MATRERPGQKVSVGVSVVPTLDSKGVNKVIQEWSRVQKQLGPLDASFKNISKTTAQNIAQIQTLSRNAQVFGKKLSAATKDSLKGLEELGDQLKEATERAADLEEQISVSTDQATKGKLTAELTKTKTAIAGLNKSVDDWKKNNARAGREFKNLTQSQEKYQKSLKEAANFSKKDAFKGAGDGLVKAMRGDLKGGFADMFKSLGKGAQGAYARSAEAKAAKVGGGEGAAMEAAAGAEMTAAMGALSAGVVAIAAFVKLLLAASDHMTGLNKALMQGNGLANEYGASAKEFRRSIDDIRTSAIKSSWAFLELGTDSEGAMKAVGAYAKEASGSIVRTEVQLKRMGGGDLTKGLYEFTKSATVYGKALGMETTEVAGLMGKMVSEIGISSENVQKTMGDIVKQASQAGMPVTKFMSIFHEAIPNVDLFTNRIEELTGMMKLLSKAMDPRAVKGFMQAMGKGFDQLDFKQRLKMALVVGPGEMQKIMSKDIGRATEAVTDQLKASGLDEEFRKAIAGPNAQKAVADLAAKAQALGVQGSTIGEMQKLARYKDLSGGGVLKQATAMRDMGLMGRLDALEKYAGRFTGGDITGLGEHVAKQLGVSEAEYKALIDMKAALAGYTASAEKYGRTSSKSINENLKKNFIRAGKLSEKANDADFEKLMKDMARRDPKGLEEEIKIASTQQIEQQQEQAKEDDKKAASMEDIAIESVKATTSIGDQIQNVIKVLLEKIYGIINEVLSMIGSLYDMLPSWITGSTKEEEKILNQWSSSAKKDLGDNNMKGVQYYQQTNRDIIAAGKTAGNSRDLMNQFTGLLSSQLGSTGDKMKPEDEERQKKLLRNVMSEKDVGKFIEASKKRDLTTTDSMLSGLDTGKMMKLLSTAAFQQAKGMEGQDFQYGGQKTDVKLQTKKQLEEARVQGDIDKRATAAAVADGGKAVGEAADQLNSSGTSPAAKAYADRFTGGDVSAISPDVMKQMGASPPADAKDAAKSQTQMAVTVAEQLDKQEDAEKKAEKDYQNTADVLSLLKKGIKFEQSWMQQKYKGVLKEASLDAFRPALEEFLIAYMRAWDDADYRKTIAGMDPGKLDLTTIAQSKSDQELKNAIANAPTQAVGAYPAWINSHESVVPNDKLLSVAGSGGQTINVGGIHINVPSGDPHAIKAKVLEAMDEIARRH